MILFPRSVDKCISALKSSFKVPDDHYIAVWNFTTDIRKVPQYQIFRKSGQWEPRC